MFVFYSKTRISFMRYKDRKCDDNDADDVMKSTIMNFNDHKSKKFQQKFIF